MVRNYVQEQAPEGWYESVDQAFRKAQNWEYNEQAAVWVVSDPQGGTLNSSRRDSSPPRNPTSGTGRNSKHRKGDKQPDAAAGKRTASNEPKQGPAKRAKGLAAEVTDVEWKARREAGKCQACGLAGHSYKVQGKLECPNLRNGAPHATITTAKPNPKAKQGQQESGYPCMPSCS